MQSSQNPFEPPRAELASPAGSIPPRPLAVRFACQLLLASVAIGLAALIPGVSAEPLVEPGDSILVIIVILTALVSISILLIAKSYEGRNWARWTNLAYLTIGWWFTAQDFNSHFQASPVAGVLEAISVLLELCATWLLFTGIGSHWFKQMSRARQSEN